MSFPLTNCLKKQAGKRKIQSFDTCKIFGYKTANPKSFLGRPSNKNVRDYFFKGLINGKCFRRRFG
jgi:hypothetical protein